MMEAIYKSRIRKQPLKARWDLEGDSSIDRRLKSGVLTKPLREFGIPFWPLSEIIEIERARLGGAGDDEVRALVRELMAARTRASGAPVAVEAAA